MSAIPHQPEDLRVRCAFLDQNCDRKPDSWDCVVRLKKPTKKMEREVFAHLPIVRVIGGINSSSPLRDFEFTRPGNRFILQFATSEDAVASHEFYINTEGYNYARYALRIR
jgi:hypothetical protein